MGYAEETYFDVNCLLLMKNVIFSSYNRDIFNKLEKRGINPIVCRWRHRLFWDGGIHCITLDLRREGETVKNIYEQVVEKWVQKVTTIQKSGHPICPYAKSQDIRFFEYEDQLSMQSKQIILIVKTLICIFVFQLTNDDS